jgi:hypothetical protein
VFGIYVKPHRGAPVQRALSGVSRGAAMLYWYTYGPNYAKGDSFADNPQTLALASKGGHLIGKTEEAIVGSAWMHRAQVAIVKPRASEFLGSHEQWENAKWVYTALAHAHIPVDPIDEVMLADDDLSRYRVIYINGSHLPRKAAANVARYVEGGGTIWTSGWGLARDEADEPLASLLPVLGLSHRNQPEVWYAVERYRAGAVQSFTDERAVLGPVPAGAGIVGAGEYAAEFMPVVGREVLQPLATATVLARYADGGAAMTVHNFGRGKAYVVGFFPGLEYSAPVRQAQFHMVRDFHGERRQFVAGPALQLVQPVVAASVPAVEGILLRNETTGRRAVTLMNWAYRVSAVRQYEDGRTATEASIISLQDMTVRIRGAGAVAGIRSAMLDRDLHFTQQDDIVTVTLPSLEEGDVLLLQ